MHVDNSAGEDEYFLVFVALALTNSTSILFSCHQIINVFFIITGMDMISLEGKTNFFEKRVAEYQKSGVMASLEGKKDGKHSDDDEITFPYQLPDN